MNRAGYEEWSNDVNGTGLACEWRLYLSPECSYVEGLITMIEATLGLSVATFIIVTIFLIIRLTLQGKTIISHHPKESYNRYLIFNPKESLFVSSVWYAAGRIIQCSLLMSGATSETLNNLFFSLPFLLPFWTMTNFAVCLIAGIPKDKLSKDKSVLEHIAKINTTLGFILVCTSSFHILFETLSGYMISIGNIYAGDVLLTISYAQWAIELIALSNATAFFGHKIIKILDGAIKSRSTISSNDEITTQLKGTLSSLKLSVLLSGGLAMSTCGLCIIYAAARYNVWRYPPIALTLAVLFNLSPGIFSFSFCLGVFIKEIMVHQQSKSLGASHNSDHLQSKSSIEVSRKSFNLPKPGNLQSQSQSHPNPVNEPQSKFEPKEIQLQPQSSLTDPQDPDQLMNSFLQEVRAD